MTPRNHYRHSVISASICSYPNRDKNSNPGTSTCLSRVCSRAFRLNPQPQVPRASCSLAGRQSIHPPSKMAGNASDVPVLLVRRRSMASLARRALHQQAG
jgi:hypothetical protein